MEKVNYIIQLNHTLELFTKDNRIKQGHLTLYMALFQKWNREFFRKVIRINRSKIMEMAKIKSKTTYHNHLRDLDNWGYLKYYPSYSPSKRSRIEMKVNSPKICTSSVLVPHQKLASYTPKPDQNLVPFLKQKNKNINKQTKPKNEQIVINYFKEKDWPEIEAKKFYAYLQSRNWKYENGINIINWKGLAFNYFKNDFKKVETYSSRPNFGHLNIIQKKFDGH